MYENVLEIARVNIPSIKYQDVLEQVEMLKETWQKLKDIIVKVIVKKCTSTKKFPTTATAPTIYKFNATNSM